VSTFTGGSVKQKKNILLKEQEYLTLYAEADT
jgi:hypothetical protein